MDIKKEALTFKDGFDKQNFMWYMQEAFSMAVFGRNLLESIVEYAIKNEHVSKDQLAYFLSDIIPEVEFCETAAFCEDTILTSNGLYEKEKFWRMHTDLEAELEKYARDGWDETDALSDLFSKGFTLDDFSKYGDTRYEWAKTIAEEHGLI